MKKKLISVLVSLSSSIIFANPIETANNLFKDRALGVTQIEAARAAYESALTTASEDQKVFVVTQIARLDFFLGEIFLKPEQKIERRKAFDLCKAGIERIAPAQLGNKHLEQYYYFRIGCLGKKAETYAGGGLTDLITLANLATELKPLANKAFQLVNDQEFKLTFEGGGIARVLSYMYSSDLTKIDSELHNPSRALKLADAALASFGASDPLYAEVLDGDVFVDNYYVKALALRMLGNQTDANSVMDEGLTFAEELISENDRIINRIPETQHAVRLMQAIR